MHKIYKKEDFDRINIIIKRGLHKNRYFIGLILFFLAVLFINILNIAALDPSGASVEPGVSESAPALPPESAKAQAGNITALNIFGYSVTQSWQGYYGNVTGVIQLADNNGNAMYNWSLANPEGEVYASTNSTIIWTMIQCFNYTANGSYVTDGEVGGETNKYGKNLTQLEAEYGVKWDDVDGVDETFFEKNHRLFYAAQKEFSENECQSAHLFTANGQSEDQKYEEVLLYEPTTTSVIFAALIEETSVMGFNQRDNDFEMLVLEDGHETNLETTTYYFFVELE